MEMKFINQLWRTHTQLDCITRSTQQLSEKPKAAFIWMSFSFVTGIRKKAHFTCNKNIYLISWK